MMGKTGVSPQEYVKEYNRRQSELLLKNPSGNRSIGIVIEEAVRSISTPEALQIFSMCCILSLEAIPLWIFEEGSKSFSIRSKSDTFKYLFQILWLTFAYRKTTRVHLRA
jgi:hypothetical protein